MGDFRRLDDLPRTREFGHMKIDPVGELEALEEAAKELRRKEEDEAATTPLFDPGSYKPGVPKSPAQPSISGLEYSHALDQLIECTGLPMRINKVQVACGAATSIMRVTYHHSIRWYVWLIRSLHSQYDNSFIRYFGRVAIAQLPQDTANELSRKVDAASQFWRARVAQSVDEEHAKDRSIAHDELRLALWIQSSLTVRMTVDEAVRVFGVASQIASDRSVAGYMIIEAAGELAKYALEAMPPDRQASTALDVIKFPPAAESSQGLVRVMARVKPKRDQLDPRWDQRIRELLAAAGPNASGRSEASERLAYLARHEVLKPNERDIFAEALWREVDKGSPPLPANTGLLASSFAELPAPNGIDAVERAKTRIFDRDLKTVMDGSSVRDDRILTEKKNHLISLYNTGPLKLPVPTQRAAEMFDQIVNWRPTVLPENEPLRAHNDFVKQLAGQVLTFTLIPAMSKEDKNAVRLQTLLDFISQNKAWLAVAALPQFLETVPTMQESIERTIHGGLSAADHIKINGATTALIQWSHLVDTHMLAAIPRTLIEELLFMIETRQEQGLHVLLYAVTMLVGDQRLTDTDMSRLVRSLSELRDETRYCDVPLDSRRAVSISLIRKQCVQLAQALKAKIADDGTLDAWIADGSSDPLPEVRFAVACE
jgi:hypothetical protein